MDRIAAAASDHVRTMRLRIEEQTALIVQLRQAGQDTLEATKRLTLLHRAFEDMGQQLARLLRSETWVGFSRPQ